MPSPESSTYACSRPQGVTAPAPTPVSASSRHSRSDGSKERRSTHSCRFGSRVSSAPFARTSCWSRAARRRLSSCSGGRSRAHARRSFSTSTATGMHRLASTGRRGAARSPRSPTPSLARQCAGPMRCGRSPRTRAGSSAPKASSRRRSFPPSWTSTRSSRPSAYLRRRARSCSSSACSSATRRWTCSRRHGATLPGAPPTRRFASSGRGRWARSSSGSLPSLRGGSPGPRRCPAAKLRARWTPPASSCCRPARRGWAAWSSRRSAAAVRSSARGSAASRISSRTVRRASSWRPRTLRRSPTLWSPSSPTGVSRSGSVLPPAGPSNPGSRHRRTTRSR